MAPHAADPPTPAGQETGPNDSNPIGPQSGLSAIPSHYNSEQGLRQSMRQIGYDEAREDGYRLRGVQLIDSVRQSLQLFVPCSQSSVNNRANPNLVQARQNIRHSRDILPQIPRSVPK